MRLFRGFLVLLAFAPLALATSAGAQESSNLDSLSLSDLLDVKVESASKQAEPWAETPVPISVITADMIEKSGVRTLKDALVLFVPGFTNSQDRNEFLFAARGLYATSQQKVLVMINGHRINSRSYLTAEPDYGIALHNVERIEILRGPGSSLYGNVALAGVVNLITKKGKDVNKNSVDVAAGNFGQQRVRFLTGSGDANYDFLGWGQYYKAYGERHDVTNGSEKYIPSSGSGSILLDGVQKPAAHDVGMNYKHGEWTFFGASRTSSYVEPYGGNKVYSYDDYRTLNEGGPGLDVSQEHFGAKWDHDLGSGWSVEANPYYDHTEVQGELANSTQGGTAIQWNDQSVGATVQANKNYSAGNVLFGAQLETFQVTDSEDVTITNGDLTTVNPATTPLLEPGGESSYSAFVQDKHHFSKEWILNAGARYDFKVRRSISNYDNLSPRVALIYLPNDTWEHKLSYSQSFVDAPYWYRYNHLSAFQGSTDLRPELLEAVQYENVWKSSDKRKRNAVTLYYQHARNMVINHPTSTTKYSNSGRVESMGLEEELAYQLSDFQFFWNLQYAYAMDSIDYEIFSHSFAHVPQLTSNLAVNYAVNKNVSANFDVLYTGAEGYDSGSGVKGTVDPATVLNLGARYGNIAHTGISADARIYNLLNTEYYQGGQTATQPPFRQPGRWWLVSLGYDF